MVAAIISYKQLKKHIRFGARKTSAIFSNAMIPGGVLSHCSVEKQTIVPLSAKQMGWCIPAECCGSHAQ
jgi:hypothetical protein